LDAVQNEVAYEYFGDCFSVTAERKYKQVPTCHVCCVHVQVVTFRVFNPDHKPTVMLLCACTIGTICL